MEILYIVIIVIIIAVVAYFVFFYSSGYYGLYYDTVGKSYVINLHGEWFNFLSTAPYTNITSLFSQQTITNAKTINLPANPNRINIGWAHIVPTTTTNNNPALVVSVDISGSYVWHLYTITADQYAKYNFMGTYANHVYSTYTSTFWNSSPTPVMAKTQTILKN